MRGALIGEILAYMIHPEAAGRGPRARSRPHSGSHSEA